MVVITILPHALSFWYGFALDCMGLLPFGIYDSMFCNSSMGISGNIMGLVRRMGRDMNLIWLCSINNGFAFFMGLAWVCCVTSSKAIKKDIKPTAFHCCVSFAIRDHNISDAYMQLDDGHYFPQVELLDEIVESYPYATLFLTFRNMSAWYKSLSNWPPKKNPKLSDRLKMLDIKGLPKGKGKDVYELSNWYCKHVQRVRDLVTKYPTHTLVEVDIQDPDIGQWLESIFGIKKRCWGQVNANSLLLSSNNNNNTIGG